MNANKLFEALTIATVDIPKLNMCVVNCTPHAIDLMIDESETATIPSSSSDGTRFGPLTLNAHCIEERKEGSLKMQRLYLPTDNGKKIIEFIKTNICLISKIVAKDLSNLYIIGSVLSAQAYAPDVVSMVPVTPKAESTEKLMRADTFQIFANNDKYEPMIHRINNDESFHSLLEKLMDKAKEQNIKLTVNVE